VPALGEGVALELVLLHELAQSRLVADVAADRPLLEPREPELGEAAVGEVTDADDPDRGQVTRPLGLGVDRGELVDEPLGQRMAGAGPADDDGVAVLHEPDGVPDGNDLAHGM
jgi:hypothetical protein